MSGYSIANRLIAWEDTVTDAPKVIDTDHAYIHEGRAFMASLTATAAAGVKKYVIDTDATKYVHFRPTQVAIASGACIFSLYEDTSSTGGAGWGTVTAYNRNRGSSVTASSLLYSAATSTGGTLIDRWGIFGGTGPGATSIGNQSGREMEIVLKRGTQYRVHIETTETFYANLFFYEESAG